MMITPDWDDLRYFLALCELGTLSGAARKIGVEHTTVARRIDALETALGKRLFDRFPKGWSLTAAGKTLMPHARLIEDNMHAMLRVASGSATLRGTVRVSAPPAMTAYLLAPHIKNAMRRLPEIELDLRGESHQSDLMKRESDIALRFNRPTIPSLAVKLLTTIKYGLCASPTYLARYAPDQWEFIGYNESLTDAPQQQWLEKFAAGRRFCLRSNDLSTLFQLALADGGIAVLPDYLINFSDGGLTDIDDAICPVARKLWMVMHEDVRRSAPVRAVADEIVALFHAE